MKLQLAPSILDADFSAIGEAVQFLEREGAHWLHLDIMDNHFVPNLTFGPPVAKHIIQSSSMPAEAHLMVKNPTTLLEGFAKAGCKRIIVHPEGENHIHRVLQTIEALGMSPAVVLNPGSPLSLVQPVIHMVDLVLIMTVNPGFGGQKFISEALDKVRDLTKLREKLNLQFHIEVDGGVNKNTIRDCALAGADMFVIGSAIFKAEDRRKALTDYLKQLKDIEMEMGNE